MKRFCPCDAQTAVPLNLSTDICKVSLVIFFPQLLDIALW